MGGKKERWFIVFFSSEHLPLTSNVYYIVILMECDPINKILLLTCISKGKSGVHGDGEQMNLCILGCSYQTHETSLQLRKIVPCPVVLQLSYCPKLAGLIQMKFCALVPAVPQKLVTLYTPCAIMCLHILSLHKSL